MFSSWFSSNPRRPAAPVLASGPQKILLMAQQVEYQLLRSTRRSIGFVINQQGLRVTAPQTLALPEIEQAIRSKQTWILDKLAARKDRKLLSEQVWEDGASLPFLGQTLRLCITYGSNIAAHRQADLLIIGFAREVAQEKIRQRVHTWLQAQAEHHFLQRLALFAPAMGVGYTSLSLSAARTQWGSCSSDGRIRLNWRLMHFQATLIDYVIIHELAHRHEMNHSPRFWAHVARLYPQYKQARKDLQDAARSLPPGL